MLVYSQTPALKESFEKVRSWYQRAKQLGGEDIEPILIGNKTDLGSGSREVSTSEGQALAKELGMTIYKIIYMDFLNMCVIF